MGPGKRLLVTSGWWEATNLLLQTAGRLGWDVDLFEADPRAPAAGSRYCKRLILAPPDKPTGPYADALAAAVRAGGYDLFVPVSDAAVMAAAPRAAEIRRHARMVLPDADAVRTAGDKAATYLLAERLGVAVPAARFPRTVGEAVRAADEFGYPCVVKKPVATGGTGVAIVRDAAGVAAAVRRFDTAGDEFPFVQQFAAGEFADYTALVDRGRVVAGFGFECPTGAFAAAAPWLVRACRDPRLAAAGAAVVRGLNWSGPIDLDFLRGPDGVYRLLEINPRFSGTVTFAARLGIDLPGMLLRLGMGEDVTGPGPLPAYPAGARYQNLIATVEYAVARPWAVAPLAWRLLDPGTRSSAHLGDPGLVWGQLKEAARLVARALR